MTPHEMKSIRKGAGLSQEGLGLRLGISRKTVNEMENGGSIDLRTALAVQALATQIKLISDIFWVEGSNRDSHLVIRRTVREIDRPNALYSGHSEVMLFGEFGSSAHAERWRCAISRSDNPRNTRRLIRSRETEMKLPREAE